MASAAVCIKASNGLLRRGRRGYGVLEIGGPVLAGASLLGVGGVGISKFGITRVPVACCGGADLRGTVRCLFVRISHIVHRNTGVLVLASHRMSRCRITVPSLLTMSKLRRRLMHAGGEASMTVVLRDKRPERIRRFTALLKCKTYTVGPCLTRRSVHRLVRTGLLRGSCCTTMSSCGSTMVRKVVGVTSGVKVSAVRSCRKTGVFRTVNLGASFVGHCFASAIDHINNVNVRRVTRSCATFRARTFSPLKLRISVALSDIKGRGCGDNKRRRLCGPRAVRVLRRSAEHNSCRVFGRCARVISRRNGGVGLENRLSFGFPGGDMPLSRMRDMSSVMAEFGANTVSCKSVSGRTRRAVTVTVGVLRNGSGSNRKKRSVRHLSAGEYSTVGRITSNQFKIASECLIDTRRVRVGVTRKTGPKRKKRLPNKGMCP